jgi:RNA processing factor Prp31
MAGNRKALLNAIGERVVELKGHSEKNIFRDSIVAEALEEIDQIDKNINEIRHKAGEISRVTG